MKIHKEPSTVMPSLRSDDFIDRYEDAHTILPAVAKQLLRQMPQEGSTDWVLLENETDGQVIEVPLHTGSSLIKTSFQADHEDVWNLELDQPATVTRFQTEYDQGENLVNLLHRQFSTKDPLNPSQWLMYRSAAEPEIVWLLGFYQNKRHRQQYAAKRISRQLFDALAKLPVSVNTHVVLSGFVAA